MLHLLYLILIAPIEYILDTCFCVIFRATGRNGILTIFYISMIVSFFALPFYLYADRLADGERRRKSEMQKWKQHIHDSFSGDERMMMTARYYRIRSYHPVHDIRGSLSVLFQIPFFAAAYHFLSNLEILRGMEQWIFSDLGAPDGLLKIGELSINILPLLMTAVNIGSVFIYTGKERRRDTVQAVILALVFLLLLYDSPSGLVFYWMLNNTFSLCKNAILKFVKRPELIAGLVILVLGAYFRNIFSIIAAIPLIYFLIKDKLNRYFEKKEAGKGGIIFLLCSSLFLFMGIIIPLTVVASSPLSFVNIYDYENPLMHVLRTACVYFGLFIIIAGLWWSVSGQTGRYLTELLMLTLLIHNLIMYFTNDKVGVLSTILTLDNPPELTMDNMTAGLLIIGLAVILGIFVYERSRVLKTGLKILIASLLCFIVFYGFQTVKELVWLKNAYGDDMSAETEIPEKMIQLSKDGKNVVILMMDRALGQLFPYIIQEKPELIESLEGFTYYPNTVSAAGHTNLAVPSVFGGYEYLPEAMEKDESRSVHEKMDEALKMLPRLFAENGYGVDIYDAPYAGGRDGSDMSIFKDIAGVNGHVLNGRYSLYCFPEDTGNDSEHNFVMYSIYRTLSIWSQVKVYDDGGYLSSTKLNMDIKSWTSGITANTDAFKNAYSTMKLLPDLTEISDEAKGNIIIMSNLLTHEPRTLQLPDYVPVEDVDNSSYPFDRKRELDGVTLSLDGANLSSYHVNMAAMILISQWCDHLRELGVYDNTRIIVVADHGKDTVFLDKGVFDNGLNVCRFNPLLLVKDFDAAGFSINDSFMCNADVPEIAVKGVVDDAVNPYTGNPIDSRQKEKGIFVTESSNHSISGQTIGANGHAYDISHSRAWRVKNDIYDQNNWTQVR